MGTNVIFIKHDLNSIRICYYNTIIFYGYIQSVPTAKLFQNNRLK